MKIIFATQNIGKLQEMHQLLDGFNVASAAEAGVTEDVIEDADTFEGNALKKARFVCVKTKMISFADDSGLCIEVLNGNPGVFSARWAGEGADDETILKHTLEKMKNIPKNERGAWFETVIVIVFPDGQEKVFKETIHGSITKELRGKHLPKLPYDSIFIPNGYKKTFAEMSEKERNNLSQRGKVFRLLREYLINKKICQ
ncbi:RdgB/HAM1 family non-canonical purine NTP pyrophosphatase [Candidatus Parcubacteria bacterium]|nr:RdgB/HAM1 family non-canonical purine NTP pyrophosphatase [Candidatus Parcubacteria bacterium]